MRIYVVATCGASENRVTEICHGEFKVHVTAQAHKGQANEKIRDIFAGYFKVPRSRLKIIRGRTQRRKVIQID